MNWGGEQRAEGAPPTDPDRQTRFATPPACPKCEMTKNQMTRAVQNYQKAYRKKVDGLKLELRTTRSECKSLRASVDRLRRRGRIHAPSLLLGGLAGALLRSHIHTVIAAVQRLKARLSSRRASGSESAEPTADGAVRVDCVDSLSNGVQPVASTAA